MTRILINGISAKAGGGKSILSDFLAFVVDSNIIASKFVFITPHGLNVPKTDGFQT